MSSYLYMRGIVTIKPEYRAAMAPRFDYDAETDYILPWPHVQIDETIRQLFAFELLSEEGRGVPFSYGSASESFGGEEEGGRMAYDKVTGELHFCCGKKWRNSVYEAFIAVVAFLSDEFIIEMDYTDPASSSGPVEGLAWYSWNSDRINMEQFRAAIPLMDTDNKLEKAVRLWAVDLKDQRQFVNIWPTSIGDVDEDVDVPAGPVEIKISFDYDTLDKWAPGVIEEEDLSLAVDEIEQEQDELFKQYVKIEIRKLLKRYNREKKRRRQRCGIRR